MADLDLTKPLGLDNHVYDFKLLTTEGGGKFPIVGMFRLKNTEGEWLLNRYTLQGCELLSYGDMLPARLINTPESLPLDVYLREQLNSLDLSKPVRLRNGSKARVYTTDGGGRRPIHGAHVLETGASQATCMGEEVWAVISWFENGRYVKDRESDYDLVNFTEELPVELYINVFKDVRNNTLYASTCSTSPPPKQVYLGKDLRYACIKYSGMVKEGEGL